MIRLAYESERTQNGQSGDAFQAALQQREERDQTVEDVPSFFEVELWAEGDELEEGFDGERGRETLKQDDKSSLEQLRDVSERNEETHVVAHFQESLHVRVHVVVIERHEERVDDDTQCDEQLDERIKDEQ
jgi:hypothetical protein